jgi:elongation factor P
VIEVSEFKKGLCIRYKDAPMQIVEVTFSTPTARGSNTIAKTKLRNLLNGQLLSESIRAGSKYSLVDLEYHPSSYLYGDGSAYHFLDNETFEQFSLTEEVLGEQAGYLIDGLEGLRAMVVEGRTVAVQLPNTVDLLVTEAEPGIKGASANVQPKKARLETGITVLVPTYIEAGERVRIDTRDGHFVERAK